MVLARTKHSTAVFYVEECQIFIASPLSFASVIALFLLGNHPYDHKNYIESIELKGIVPQFGFLSLIFFMAIGSGIARFVGGLYICNFGLNFSRLVQQLNLCSEAQ